MKSTLVVLDAFPNVVIAEMVKDRLDAEGIEAFVADENTAHLYAGLESLIGGVRVLVAPDALDGARDVLANLSQPLGSAPDDLTDEEFSVLAAKAEAEEPTPPAAPPTPEEEDLRERRLRRLFGLVGLVAVALLVVRTIVRVARGLSPF